MSNKVLQVSSCAQGSQIFWQSQKTVLKYFFPMPEVPFFYMQCSVTPKPSFLTLPLPVLSAGLDCPGDGSYRSYAQSELISGLRNYKITTLYFLFYLFNFHWVIRLLLCREGWVCSAWRNESEGGSHCYPQLPDEGVQTRQSQTLL